MKGTSFCGALEGFTFISKPEGDSHSNKNIINVAACIATKPTSIQEAVSNGSGRRYRNITLPKRKKREDKKRKRDHAELITKFKERKKLYLIEVTKYHKS